MRFEKITKQVGMRLRNKGSSRSAGGFASDSTMDSPTSAGPPARPDRKHVRPGSYVVISFLFSLLLFGFFLVSDHGFIGVGRQRKQLSKMQTEVSALAAENQKLEEEVAALKSDPQAVEKIAREELNLVKPNDVVLLLPAGWRKRVAPRESAAAVLAKP